MAINYNVNRTSMRETTSDSQGAYVLADNPKLYEIQRRNNFEFVVPNIDNILRAGTSSKITNAKEVLRVSVVSAPIPHFSQNPIEIRRGNSVIKAAGVPTFTNGTLVVNDYIGADTKAVLMAWQNLSYNVRTEKVGLMADYKKIAWLTEYTPDYQVVRKWKLSGCWVSSITEQDYNMDSNDKGTISATIEYDKAEIDTSGTV